MVKLLVAVSLLVAAVVAGSIKAATSGPPPDNACVSWERFTATEPTPDPELLFVAARAYVKGFDVTTCIAKGDVIPCWSADPGAQTWGHHDYNPRYFPHDVCRSWVNGTAYESQTMYIAKRTAQSASSWKWQLAQTGGKIPSNAFNFGGKVLVQNTAVPIDFCMGLGFLGWSLDVFGTLGEMHYTIRERTVTTNTFKVAVCGAAEPTPVPATPTPLTPVPATPQPPAPQTPSPTASPTLPPNNKPYIRFGNTIPSTNKIDAVVSQGNVSFTWTNYAFGDFSHWVEIFSDGFGSIDLYENNNGVRGRKLMSKFVRLTPGPLIIVTRDLWPPHNPWNVETIAASYTPGPESGVRLFNLSPDTLSAGMNGDGTQLVDGVKYSLGSVWAPVNTAEMTFSVFDDATKKTLAKDTFVPPPSPFVFTNFLIGLQNATNSALGTRLVPLIDAPEQ